nr:ATP-binding cassette domain-containing protein [Entomoplasma sp. MP1]
MYRGECISLLGSNGSGKTTLLRIIANNLKIQQEQLIIIFKKKISFKAIVIKSENASWPNGFKVKDINDLWIRIYDMTDLEWINKLKDVFGVNEIEENTFLNYQLLDYKFMQYFCLLFQNLNCFNWWIIFWYDFKYEEKLQFFIEYLAQGNTMFKSS